MQSGALVKAGAVIIACVLHAHATWAGLDPYTITRTTGITYVNIVGGTGTVAVSSWRNGSSSDDNLSNDLPIGFTFSFDGSPQTHFRVSTNGFITFNTSTNATGAFQTGCENDFGDAYSGDNRVFSTPGTKGTLSALAPFYDDLITNGQALNSSMHYQTSGTAPNRVLTVQWRGLSKYVNTSNCSPCSYGNYNFQVKLYEATGNIEFIYSTMTAGADEDSKNYSCGMNSASLTSSPSTSQLLSQQSANSTNFTANHVNNLSTLPTANSMITFTRTAPAPAAGVPTCIDYNFPANGATNQCRNMIISWSACDGVPTAFDVYFGTAANPPLAVSDKIGNYHNPGTLAANTTYYWKIVPKNAFGPAAAANMPVRSFTTGVTNSVTGITSSLGTSICAGSTTVLTVSGTLAEGSEYVWTAPFLVDLGCKTNPPYPLIGDCGPATRNFSSNTAGNYKFDVFVRGCNTTSSCASITITVIANATAPTGITSSAGTSFCTGTSTTLTASGGTHVNGMSYVWYSGGCGSGTPIANSGSTNATTHSITVTPAASTTYYVRREGQCPSATGCFSVAITVQNPAVGNNTISGNQSICSGQAPAALTGSLPTGGSVFTYQWESSTTSATAGFAPIANSNIQSYSPGPLTVTTWFRRKVTQVDGCASTSISNAVQVTVGASCNDGSSCTMDICENGVCRYVCTLDVTSLIYISNTIQGCNDGSITATINTGTCSGAWQVFLYQGASTVRTWTSAQGTSLSWTNLPAGSYLIVATDFAGCADSSNVTIGAGLPCSMQLSNEASTPTSVQGCGDGTINAIVNAFTCGGAWNVTLYNELNNPVRNWLHNQGTAVYWNNLPAGNYSISATDGGNCTATSGIAISSGGPPCRLQIQNVQKTVTDCEHNTITADIASLTCDGAWYVYLYDNAYFNYIATWGYLQGENIVWNDIPLGDYHIYATNDFASCSDTFDITLSCSDNDPCTIDNCVGGCSYLPKCDDGNPCTNDFCQANGTCLNLPLVCNDNNPCTADQCSGGTCIHNPRNCADNNPCTIDQCVSGNCVHTLMNCNDNNSCTSDFCQGGNCINTPLCVLDDNNPCTDDYCVNRVCLHIQKSCDDGNTCTSDLCVGGICQNTPVCVLDDGIACTRDQCLNGVCTHVDTCAGNQCQSNPAICNDGDPCTADTCISNACAYPPRACNDANSCTSDFCQAGNCIHTPICVIDDGNPCTNDGCINGECFHVLKSCNDFNDCTRDSCINGTCVFHPLCQLDDGDLCTSDFCFSGQCIHQQMFCNDGILCTDDTCRNGQCVFEPLVCNDGNTCTADSCFSGNCIHMPIPNCCVQQNIAITAGWNTISGYVIPDNPGMANVFNNIVSNIIIVKNNSGQAYIPAFGINNIGDWDFRQGYKVKASAAAALVLQCTPANPATVIPLNAGWHTVAYLHATPMNVAAALASLGSGIIIVKNNAGQSYIPAYNINNLGSMLPGQGYQLKLSNAGTLIYPAPKTDGSLPFEPSPLPVHFGSAINTGSNATVIFPQGTLDGWVKAGDEIAVVNAAGIIAGAAVVESKSFALTVWGDDITTDAVAEGMTSEETFRFIHWNKTTGIEQPLTVSFAEGPDYFTVNGISIAVQKTTGAYGISAASQCCELRAVPNPFSGSAAIVFVIREAATVSIVIYDIFGRGTRHFSGEFKAGEHKIEWAGDDDSGKSLSSGLYHIRMRVADDNAGLKVLLAR